MVPEAGVEPARGCPLGILSTFQAFVLLAFNPSLFLNNSYLSLSYPEDSMSWDVMVCHGLRKSFRHSLGTKKPHPHADPPPPSPFGAHGVPPLLFFAFHFLGLWESLGKFPGKILESSGVAQMKNHSEPKTRRSPAGVKYRPRVGSRREQKGDPCRGVLLYENGDDMSMLWRKSRPKGESWFRSRCIIKGLRRMMCLLLQRPLLTRPRRFATLLIPI